MNFEDWIEKITYDVSEMFDTYGFVSPAILTKNDGITGCLLLPPFKTKNEHHLILREAAKYLGPTKPEAIVLVAEAYSSTNINDKGGSAFGDLSKDPTSTEIIMMTFINREGTLFRKMDIMLCEGKKYSGSWDDFKEELGGAVPEILKKALW